MFNVTLTPPNVTVLPMSNGSHVVYLLRVNLTEYNGKIAIHTIFFFFPLLHYRPLTMVVSSLIHCVKQSFLISLTSLAIVFATIRANLSIIQAALREAGFSPLFVFSLLGTLSIYCGIAIIQCCERRERRHVRAHEEYGIIDLEVVEGRVLLLGSLRSHRQVNHPFLVFFASLNSNIC